MTSEGLGEMFEGDSADMCARKLPLVLMGGRAEGLACANPGARTPICASGNLLVLPDFVTCQNHISLTIISQWGTISKWGTQAFGYFCHFISHGHGVLD